MAKMGKAQAQGVKSPNPTGPKGTAHSNQDLRDDYKTKTFTGKIVDNPNKSGKGAHAGLYPKAAIYDDPINHSTKIIPINSDGTPVRTPPVGPPYEEDSPGKFDTWDDPLSQQMADAGFDPSKTGQRWAFAAKFSPRMPDSVRRQATAHGLGDKLGRETLDSLPESVQRSYEDREARRMYSDAYQKSLREHHTQPGPQGGISVIDPSIPSLDSGYWQKRAREKQAAWAATSSGPIPPIRPPVGGHPDPDEPPIDEPPDDEPPIDEEPGDGGPGPFDPSPILPAPPDIPIPPVQPPPIGKGRPPYDQWPIGVGDLGPGLGEYPWWVRGGGNG